jgi:AMP deaminase
MDLDYILGIISDGPAKSFAYRRLRYLESKWNLYTLLNEYQELADSKVIFFFVNCVIIQKGILNTMNL